MTEREFKKINVDDDVIQYVEYMFSVDSILITQSGKDSDFVVGYLTAVRDIINNLKMLKEE